MMVKVNGEEMELTRVNNCVNGNPRYVVHFLALGLKEYKSTKKTREAGFSIYRGREYGGGFVFSSYSPEVQLERMLEILNR